MAWYDFIGDVFDWFDDNEWAQDIVGAGAQAAFFDKPELDYEKLKEMAAQNALIQSPDQNTPTMISNWTVDPKTGERKQDLTYRPEFQALLESLTRKAGTPFETYRAPTSMTEGLLGARINTLNKQSGLPEVSHSRFQFPTRTAVGGTGSGGTGPNPTPPSGPGPGGPPGPGPGNHPVHPPPNETGTNEDDQSTGGPGPAGNHGGYDPFDPSFDNENLIRDLIDGGYMQPGQNLGDVDWNAVFSDDNLAFVEKWAGNRFIQLLLNKLIPFGGTGAKIAAYFAGRELDQRAGENLSDFDNREWGSFDTGGIGQGDFSDSYWEQLLGNAPGVNPDTGARLGEAGGMPGATQNWDDIMRGLQPGRDHTPADFNTGQNFGREAFGVGSRYGGRLGDSVIGGGLGDNYNGFSDSGDFAAAVRDYARENGVSWGEAADALTRLMMLKTSTGSEKAAPK